MPLYIDVRKLAAINDLIYDGASNVADSLESLAGVGETTVGIKSLSMVDPGDLDTNVRTSGRYGASVQLHDPPYGVFMMTFTRETAENLAATLAGSPVDDGFNKIHESALQEVCNIFTSSFIDGLANTLGVTIDMGTPELQWIKADEPYVTEFTHVEVNPLVIVLDSVVDVEEDDAEFAIRVFLVPDAGSFVNVLDRLGEPGSSHDSRRTSE